MKTRQMGAIPPSAILSRKGIALYGGVSRTGPLSTPRGSCDNTPSEKSSWKVSRDCFREGSKKAS